MNFLSVPNLSKHQHYKDRRPPWIKLHASLLQDYEFSLLSDSEKYQLIGLWLLASQLDNKIPHDERWLCTKIQASKINLNKFIELQLLEIHASTTLASCKQSAIVETETEAESKTEKKGRFAPPSWEEVADYIRSRGSDVDPQAFIDHYEANGWYRGKTKIKDWRACVRTWEKKTKGNGSGNIFAI